MKNKFIIIEGADGAGKATQTELLVRVLSKKKRVTVLDFPRYEESVFGSLIGRCLAGEFGDFLNLSPYISSLPYMLDRVSAKDDIRSALKKGVVISNRYTPSNLAHQAAKLPPRKREEFIKFIEYGEYDELGLPRPDVVVYLSVPPKISAELILKKKKRAYLAEAGTKDMVEDVIEYQEKVAGVYKALCVDRSDWYEVKCVERGRLLSPMEIHERVMEVLEHI